LLTAYLGLSVSRFGSAAQLIAFKEVVQSLKLESAQFICVGNFTKNNNMTNTKSDFENPTTFNHYQKVGSKKITRYSLFADKESVQILSRKWHYILQ
jgi:F0F1-type ATP synthase alpha subunit